MQRRRSSGYGADRADDDEDAPSMMRPLSANSGVRMANPTKNGSHWSICHPKYVTHDCSSGSETTKIPIKIMRHPSV